MVWRWGVQIHGVNVVTSYNYPQHLFSWRNKKKKKKKITKFFDWKVPYLELWWNMFWDLMKYVYTWGKCGNFLQVPTTFIFLKK